MKNIINKLLFMILMLVSFVITAAEPEPLTDEEQRLEGRRGFIETHNAIESASLRISLDDSLHGFVEGKVCDFCETIKVTITPKTKAYSKNVEVPLKKAKDRIGRFATVMYELDTKNVSEIRW